MSDTIYRVLTVYDADASKHKSELGGLASMMDHVLNLGEKLKGVVESIIELSSEAQNARIAIAGLISAGDFPGARSNFQMSMEMSSEIIKKMRKDARDLPGEFEDLQSIFQFGLLGGSQAGKSVNQVEEMSAKLMSVTKALGIQSEFAGREFSELMEGRASSRVTLFAKLKGLMGDKDMDAKKFNALSAPEKWEKIQKALSSFGPMIDEYQKTWDAVSSTATDYAKTLVRIGSAAVFDKLNSGLQAVNSWYEKNQQSVDDFVTSVGEFVASVIERVLPPLIGFLSGIVDVGKVVWGTLKGIGETIAEAFGAGSSLVKEMGVDMQDIGRIVGEIGVAFGIVLTVMKSIEVVTGIVTAITAMNPFTAWVLAGTALAAILVMLIAYFDELERKIEGMFDTKASRWLLKKAGIIPQNATDADMDEALTKGRSREAKSAENMMREEYGSTGVMAHVKSALGWADRHAIAGANANSEYGPFDTRTAAQKALDLHKTPEKSKADMNVNVKIEQTINTDENPDRLLILTKDAIHQAMDKPAKAFVQHVYK